MSWFNYIGLIIITVIMLPNIIYAIKLKGNFPTSYKNKSAEFLEQIGRYGCFVLMIFNIPYTYFTILFNLWAYIAVNSVLCIAYLICWVVFRNKTNMPRALTLSIIPSGIFLFSGIILLSIPLIVFAIIFSSCHIFISCKNAD